MFYIKKLFIHGFVQKQQEVSLAKTTFALGEREEKHLLAQVFPCSERT